MSPTAIPAVENERLPAIDSSEFVTVRLPFVHPFGTSVHTWTVKEALLLHLVGGGASAWGECVADPDPFYLPETTTSCRHIIRSFLLPLLRPGMTVGEMVDEFEHVRGNRMAKATVENAVLVLLALQKHVPLHTLLGYPAKRVMSGLSIGLKNSPEELVEAVAGAVEKRYHRVKMKVSRGKDVDYVRAVRKRFPALRLMVDANGDYTLDDAGTLKLLDEFGLMMIEQPLSYADFYQHGKLQKSLSTPICLDESILSFDDAVAAVELGACRVLNIKQGRVGGIIESLRIARYAAAHGIDVWSGGMDETGIGRALNIHLQTAEGYTLPGDTSETRNYFEEDLIDRPVVLDEGGYIQIPPGEGLGVTVDQQRLTRYMIEREQIQRPE
jgi:O-succinylbenzoate synthase